MSARLQTRTVSPPAAGAFLAGALLAGALLAIAPVVCGAGALAAQSAAPAESSGVAREAPPHADRAGNLVPNASFEDFRVRPLGWYYKGAQFDRVVRYWHSPTSASPDAYNSDVRVPQRWADKGFGEHAPHRGGASAGITVYGCADGKPHCREYLQVQLTEPLVPGQRYGFGMHVATLARGLRVSRLGAAFAGAPFRFPDDRRLPVAPDVVFGEVVDPGEGWIELHAEFTADSAAGYLVIGNFDDDNSTAVARPATAAEPLNFAYYYIDDVELRKLDPLVPVPVAPDDLSLRELSHGEAVTLRHVYFDHDRDELQPVSFGELDKLVALLARQDSLRVRIVGHTDDAGTDAYNVDLSERRAAAVVDYLTDRGVDRGRLGSEGRGSRQPLADNGTPGGRKLNRRVVAEVE